MPHPWRVRESEPCACCIAPSVFHQRLVFDCAGWSQLSGSASAAVTVTAEVKKKASELALIEHKLKATKKATTTPEAAAWPLVRQAVLDVQQTLGGLSLPADATLSNLSEAMLPALVEQLSEYQASMVRRSSFCWTVRELWSGLVWLGCACPGSNFAIMTCAPR